MCRLSQKKKKKESPLRFFSFWFRPAPTSRIPDLGVGDEQEDASVCRSVWDTLSCGCLGGRVCTFWETVFRVFVCSLSIKTKIVPPRGHYLPFSAAFLQLNCRRREFTAPARRHRACPRKRPLQRSLNNSQMMASNIYRRLLSWMYNNGCCQQPLGPSNHTQSEQLRCKTCISN